MVLISSPNMFAFPTSEDVVLTEEEKVRRLVLHFGVPRTICTWDRLNERTTEAELNRVLCEMAWGREDHDGSWVMLAEEPSLDRPDPSLISYMEYLNKRYPTTGVDVDDTTRIDNKDALSEKTKGFTAADQPGAKFRSVYDTLVKSLSLPKNVMKGLNLAKVTMDEGEIPEDPSSDAEAANAVRYGRFQFLPAFFNLIIALQKEKRKFQVVFHSFSDRELEAVRKEMQMFCEGRHPCYNGQFKTKKVLMTGEKGQRDLRMKEEYMGVMDRMGETLSFKDRNSVMKADPAEGGAGTEGGDPTATAGDDEGLPEATFAPTAYKGNAQIYAGLECELLEEVSCVGIIDDYEYWSGKEESETAGKVLYVDDGETTLQHIFFDGNIRSGNTYSVDIRDAVTEKPKTFQEAQDVYFHRVNTAQAIMDPEYYIKALQLCEATRLEQIKAQKCAKSPNVESAKRLTQEELRQLPAKDYLYETVMPGLLPALELCQRDRPKDPIQFIAFYLLRHPFTYTKSVGELQPVPALSPTT